MASTSIADMLAKKYSGRPDGVACVNFSFEKPALELLYHYCGPGRRTMGKFLSRLVFEHHAREEERRRIREAISMTNAGGEGAT